MKLLEVNVGRTLFDIIHSNVFFTCLLRQMEQKKKKKRDLIKLKSFCTANKNTDKMKR